MIKKSLFLATILFAFNPQHATAATCASQVDFSQCRPCVGPPVGCVGQNFQCAYVENEFKQCLAALETTSRQVVKYNLFAADYNFLEIINLSTTKKLSGYYRIRAEDSSILQRETEFEIDASGRKDFSIHDAFSGKRFGIVEIVTTAENTSLLSYVSYYNQRAQATAAGTALDQTITVPSVVVE